MRKMRMRLLSVLLLLCYFSALSTSQRRGRYSRRGRGGGGGRGRRGSKAGKTEDGEDFYKILGVNRHASASDMKRAFRKQTLKYHPDRNPDDKAAHDMFVKVNRAYEVLTDEEKRRIYDRHGEEGVKEHESGQRAGGGGGFNPFASFFGHQPQPEDDAERRGPDINADLFVTLADLYVGKIWDIDVHRQQICDHCYGSGAESESDMHTCDRCGGTGVIMERRSIGPGFVQQVQRECPKCKGKGKIITKKCHVCGGTGTVNGKHSVSVDLLPGTPDGHKIELENEADEFPDMHAGHLYFTVRTVRDPKFPAFVRDKEKPEDLHYYLKINLLQALVGYDLVIQHFEHNVTLSTKEVTQPGSVRIVEGEGMPVLHSFPQRFGDLHVHFEIDFPKDMPSDHRDSIRGLSFE